MHASPLIFILLLSTLIISSYKFSRKFLSSNIQFFLSTYIIFWSQVVLASLVSGLFGVFNSVFYFSLSCTTLSLALLLCTKFFKNTPKDQDSFYKFKKLEKSELFCIVVLFLATLCSLSMSLLGSYQIPDAPAIKLPNAFFYLQQGSFIPARAFADEWRMFGSPINGTLLVAFFMRFFSGPTHVLLSNCMHWVFMGLGLFALLFELKLSRKSALIACTLYLLSFVVLGQSYVDGDDLLSSTPGIIACVFILKFIRDLKTSSALIAGLAFGLCFGAKGFPAFYWPALLGLCFFKVYHAGIFSSKKWVKKNLGAIFVFGLSSFTLGLNFFLIQFYLKYFKGEDFSHLISHVQNRPFRLEVFWQNFVIHNLQMLFAQILDLLSFSYGQSRESLVTLFNAFFDKLIPDTQNGTVLGLKPVLSPRDPDIYSSWYMFFPYFLYIGGFISFKKKNWTLFFFFVLFVCWNLYFCAYHKYMEQMGRYFMLAMALATPLVAYAVERLMRSRARIFVGLAVSSVLFVSVQGLLKNEVQENLVRLIRGQHLSRFWYADSKWISPELKVQIKEEKLLLLRTQYGFPTQAIIDVFLKEQTESSTFSYLDLEPNAFAPYKTVLYQASNAPLLSEGFSEYSFLFEVPPNTEGALCELTKTGLGPLLARTNTACAAHLKHFVAFRVNATKNANNEVYLTLRYLNPSSPLTLGVQKNTRLVDTYDLKNPITFSLKLTEFDSLKLVLMRGQTQVSTLNPKLTTDPL